MLSRIEPVLLVLADTVLGSSVWVGHYSLVSTGDRSPGISHNLAIQCYLVLSSAKQC